jgi:tetratricopeptide (TPR) repeat protein
MQLRVQATAVNRPSALQPRGAARRLASGAAAAAPGLLLVALWLTLAVEDGGYFPRSWYPAAIATVVLLAAVAAGARRLLPEPRAVRIALALLAALVALSYLSLAWAGSRADAYEAANQLLLVLATAWCMAIQPLGARGLVALAGLWSVGVAALCAVELVSAIGATDPSGFVDPATQRPSAPTGYPNAAAALAAMAMLPAVALAAWRGLPAVVRGALLAVATFLAQYALLPQTRATAVGIAVAVPVLLSLSADRVRLAVRLVVVGALVAVAAPELLDVGDAAIARDPLGGPLDGAGRAMALTAAVAAVAGTLLALLDDRVRPRRPSPQARRRLVAAAALVTLLAAGGAAAAFGDRVVDWAESTWSAPGPDSSRSRLLSLSPEERPDYARVAVDMFEDDPVAGAGAGNFGREYDARRSLPKQSRYAHNIALRFLSENGAVGLLLFLGVLGALGWGAVARRRTVAPEARLATAAAVGVGAYLLGHAALDWLEEFAALAAPAAGFAFAALALALPDGSQAELPWWERLRRRNRAFGGGLPRPVAIGTGVAAVAIALAVLVPPWLSARYLDRAREGGTPEQIREDLRRAGQLNPFTPAAALGEGRLAIELGRPEDARAAYLRALEREDAWFAHLHLALLDAQAGRWADAERRLEQASRLSAEDPVVAEARRRVLRRVRIDPAEFDRTVVEQPLSRRSDIG